MSRLIYVCIILFSCSSCFRAIQKEDVKIDHQELIEASTYKLQVEYAKGFTLEYKDDLTILTLRNPTDTNEVYGTFRLSRNGGEGVLKTPIKRLALQSTTHVPYVEQLNPEAIVGMSYTELVKSEITKGRIQQNLIQDISGATQFNHEKLIGMNPDLTLVYPFDMKQIKTLEELKVRFMLCFEYLETSLLGRAEWVKFFGVLLGEEEKAQKIFIEIATNFNADQEDEDKGLTLVNLPFGEQWNVPSGLSPTAELLSKAGFNYKWKSNLTQGNQMISMEEIIETGMEAENWVIFASRPVGFNLDLLIAENPLYAKFKSVKNHKVYFCNTGITPYFEMANIEPDQLLKDLITTVKTRDTTKYFIELK